MNSRDDVEAEPYPYSRPGRSELGRFRLLAQDERDAVAAWLADG